MTLETKRVQLIKGGMQLPHTFRVFIINQNRCGKLPAGLMRQNNNFSKGTMEQAAVMGKSSYLANTEIRQPGVILAMDFYKSVSGLLSLRVKDPFCAAWLSPCGKHDVNLPIFALHCPQGIVQASRRRTRPLSPIHIRSIIDVNRTGRGTE